MTGREALAAQKAEVRRHMGELRSIDGGRVERLLAERAAEPTRMNPFEKGKAPLPRGAGINQRWM